MPRHNDFYAQSFNCCKTLAQDVGVTMTKKRVTPNKEQITKKGDTLSGQYQERITLSMAPAKGDNLYRPLRPMKYQLRVKSPVRETEFQHREGLLDRSSFGGF